MYKKYYNLKEVNEIIENLIRQGKKKLNFEKLIDEIGCDIRDINEYYIKEVKHRLRYEKER